MKLIIVLLSTILITSARAQLREVPNPSTGVAMGLSGGYSSKECMIGTLSLGAMVKGNHHLSINLTALSDIKNPEIPSIGEVRIGHFFSTWEFYGGAAYHLAGSDHKVYSNPNTGLRPAVGVIKHFTSSPWTLSAGMSGRIFSLQLGLFGVK